MNTESIEMITEYQNKAMLSLRAMGDMNVSNAQWFVNQQIELGNKVLAASMTGFEQLKTVKSPEDFMKTSTEVAQNVADELTGFVKDAAAQAVEARDSLKAVLDDAAKLNTEYAEKAYKTGLEAVNTVAASVPTAPAAAPAKAPKAAKKAA